eukprot:491916-Hanusia_phi.AAC.2
MTSVEAFVEEGEEWSGGRREEGRECVAESAREEEEDIDSDLLRACLEAEELVGLFAAVTLADAGAAACSLQEQRKRISRGVRRGAARAGGGAKVWCARAVSGCSRHCRKRRSGRGRGGGGKGEGRGCGNLREIQEGVLSLKRSIMTVEKQQKKTAAQVKEEEGEGAGERGGRGGG